MPDRKISEIILILGMHRSGTSALARAINLLGYGIPQTLIKANETNEKGHWESRPVARLNDRILNAGELNWFNWQRGKLEQIPAADIAHFEKDIQTTLAQEFAGHTRIVLKDPRICRLAPLYLATAENMDATMHPIITFRMPLEVMRSLEKRSAIDPIDGALLWLRHMLDAVHATQGMTRSFIQYSTLLEDWRGELTRIGRDLGLNWPIAIEDAARQIEAHLDGTLRHHEFTSADLVHDERTQGWVSEAYEALSILEHNPLAKDPLETLARIREEFNTSDRTLYRLEMVRKNEKDAALKALEKAEKEHAESIAALHTEREALLKTHKSALDKLTSIQESNKETLDKTRQDLEIVRAQRDTARAERKTQTERLKAREKELRQLNRQHWRLKDELAWQKDILRSVYGSTSWRLTRPIRAIKTRLTGKPAIAHPPPPSRQEAGIPAANAPPTSGQQQKTAGPSLDQQLKTIETSGQFDAAFYLANYPEAQLHSQGALHHYAIKGWQKGYDPSPVFVTNAWIAGHKGLETKGIIPLYDAIKRGLFAPSQAGPETSSIGKIAVFSAITGGYDSLKDPEISHENVDYFLFTDGDVPELSKWQKRDLEYVDADPTRTARFVKTHPHLWFSDYDWAIWVDANLQIVADPAEIIAALEPGTHIASWHHPLRDCVYDEAEECIARNKDNTGSIADFVSFLSETNFPRQAGLLETSVFISKMKDAGTGEFFAKWWQLIDRYSRRDQLALPVALKEHPLNLDYLADKPVCMRTDPRFIYHRHNA